MAINTEPLVDPRYMEFRPWAELMCEQFAGQQIQIPNDDTDWREWANGLNGISLFNNEGIPDQSVFESWDSWATALVLTLNARQND